MSSPSDARGGDSLRGHYFDDIYRAHADPWAFESSPYEAEKYAATLQALGDRHFDSAFEIGCSIGVLTAQLAPRCAHLLAVDVSDAPLVRARERCAALPQVDLQRMAVPEEFPGARFDLVLTSEVGYYWSRADLARVCEKIAAALQPGGLWLLVHWTPPVHDYPLTGDEVHDRVLNFASESGVLRHLSGRREDSYRLDLVQRLVARQDVGSMP